MKEITRLGKILRIIILILLFSSVSVLGFLVFNEPGIQSQEQRPGRMPALPTPAATTPTPAPTPTPEPTPYYYTPAASDSSAPEIFGYKRELELNGSRIDSFKRNLPLKFKDSGEYSELEGVLTFRGNNYRNSASYGITKVSTKKLNHVWTVETGSMSKGISGDGSWTGSGWVGQPLIVRWPNSTKQIMNLYESAKSKENLVEVILATMDGNVYFTDLETGEPTRDKLRIGTPFKGAGSLDPRGYPILYLGSGDCYNDDKRDTRALIYSLIDFSRLFEFGQRKDPFALRSWHAYDSAPLINKEADLLIYPGENGIIYTMKLNTNYNEAEGKLSVEPSEVLKYRYFADRTGESKYWLGYEDSAAAWGSYLYLSDNAGLMQCIDLNTMDIVWVQDTWDDTNGSPVLEVAQDEHTAYIYIGTSLHFKANSEGKGKVALFKIDAVTGKVIWEHVRNVRTVSGVSGGIQATALLGQGKISDLIIVPFARTPSTSNGILVALDKYTGIERWSYELEAYAWSSPLAIYDEQGNAYIIQADTRGHIYLLEGETGRLLDTLFFENNNFEASPAAYGDTIVIGSRAAKIYGIKIS